MYDEPDEDQLEHDFDPAVKAREKSDEFRIHAELAAVFEGPRKFDAQLLPRFDPQLARDVQRTVGRLEKSRPDDSPVLPATSAAEAAGLLSLPQTRGLATNDYHLHRRPGEVMIVRWLAGDQVESFYERIQAHFDAALKGFKEEERQARGWKQDPKTLAFLAALDAVNVRMADRYLRDLIRKHSIFVLSTQTADELNIVYLCDYIMGVALDDIFGAIPGTTGAEQEGGGSEVVDPFMETAPAWFFKLFSLRGMIEGAERMCFFAYLNKSDEMGDQDG